VRFCGSSELWVSVILLAAGKGKRMGLQKLLLPWGRETVIEAVLRAFLASGVKEIIVVLGEDLALLRNLLGPYRVKLAFNPLYSSGMASSIRKGLEYVDPRAQGIMIALGDMPLIRPALIDGLLEAFGKGKGIVVPVFKGRRGHPVLFPRSFQGELMGLSGDEGGRRILEEHRDEIIEIEVDDPAILMDMDTLEDYERLLSFARSAGHFHEDPGT